MAYRLLCLCAFFTVAALQMVAVNASEKLMSYIAEELKKDAETVKEHLENLKYSTEHKMAHYEITYHSNMDTLIAETELEIMSMLCREDTMDRVRAAREYGWGTFKECVDLTRAFADGEMVIYDAVLYLEDVLKLVRNISHGITECRHTSLFMAMSCVVETIANHSADYKNKSDTVLQLLDRMDNITHEIYETFRECIGVADTKVFSHIDKVIEENCEKHSFLRRLINAVKSKLNIGKKVSYLKETPTKEENRAKTPTGKHQQKAPAEEHKN